MKSSRLPPRFSVEEPGYEASSFLHSSLDLYRSYEHLRVDIVALQLKEAASVLFNMPWKVNSYTWRITGSYKLTGSAS